MKAPHAGEGISHLNVFRFHNDVAFKATLLGKRPQKTAFPLLGKTPFDDGSVILDATGLGLSLGGEIFVALEALFGGQATGDHAGDGLDHGDGIIGLEDGPAHIHTARTLVQSVFTHLEGVKFWKLLTTSDDDWHRAAGSDSVEFRFRVVALHDVASEFCHDPGSETEILRRASHGATDSGDTHDGDAVTAGLINEIREVFERLALVFATDEHLDSENAGVQADGVFDAAGEAFVGEWLITRAAQFDGRFSSGAFPFVHAADHAGAAGSAEGDCLARAGWDHGTLNAAGEHEAVNVRFERENRLVDPLQAGRWALEITVVKGQHERAAVLRIEYLAQAVFQAPVVLVGTFEEETWSFLGNRGEEFFCLLGGFAV